MEYRTMQSGNPCSRGPLCLTPGEEGAAAPNSNNSKHIGGKAHKEPATLLANCNFLGSNSTNKKRAQHSMRHWWCFVVLVESTGPLAPLHWGARHAGLCSCAPAARTGTQTTGSTRPTLLLHNRTDPTSIHGVSFIPQTVCALACVHTIYTVHLSSCQLSLLCFENFCAQWYLLHVERVSSKSSMVCVHTLSSTNLPMVRSSLHAHVYTNLSMATVATTFCRIRLRESFLMHLWVCESACGERTR